MGKREGAKQGKAAASRWEQTGGKLSDRTEGNSGEGAWGRGRVETGTFKGVNQEVDRAGVQ